MAFVRPKTIGLFSYSTLKTKLYLEEKSLEIQFQKPHLNLEMLFELESLLNWCKIHVEVHSIVFTGAKDHFIHGFDVEEFKNADSDKANRSLCKFEQILTTMNELPQVLYMNLKSGATDQGLELALQGDVIYSRQDAVCRLGHLEKGLIPSKKTEKKVGINLLKNLLFTEQNNLTTTLEKNHFVKFFTDETAEIDQVQNFRKHILSLSNVARYYFKKTIASDNNENERQLLIESNDYKNDATSFLNLHHYVYPELQEQKN